MLSLKISLILSSYLRKIANGFITKDKVPPEERMPKESIRSMLKSCLSKIDMITCNSLMTN